MKKTKAILLSSVLCVAALFTGCDSETEGTVPRAEISEIKENFAEDCEALKNKGYRNLSFTNTTFSFPDIDEVSELTLEYFVNNDLTTDEYYEYFSEAVDALTDNFLYRRRKKI